MLDDRAPAHAMVFSRILRKGQLNRHTRYRPADRTTSTTRNTATQRSCHSVD